MPTFRSRERWRRPKAAALAALFWLACGLSFEGRLWADDVGLRPSDQHDAAPPLAVGTRLDRAGDATRLSFDLSLPVQATATVVEDPDRVIVDLPEVNFQIDPAAGRVRTGAGALVRSFRFGLFAPGRSRIVIDLAGPAAVGPVSTVSIGGGDPSRLTIELSKTDRASFHKAALAGAVARTDPVPLGAVLASAATGGEAADAASPIVVIDPGHGGVDPGASGLEGTIEKTVVLDFATTLAAKLRASGKYRVIMTREGDAFVSLGDRVRIARDARAQLLVSIHADTLAVSGGVTGATVYTAADKASDAEAARVAEAENRADSAAGIESSPGPSDVSDILFDLTRRETRTYAHLFQRTLVGYWQKIARLNKNPERSAGFMVLRAPDVPSVLLELGYLSSDRDVKALQSPQWRDQATGSVMNAIDAFFSPRHPSTGVVTADRPAATQVSKAPTPPEPSAN